MGEYKTKAVIIGRKKDSGVYAAFIALFDDNEPHKSGKAPEKVLDFLNCRNVRILGCDVKYMVAGNDIIINDLEKIEVEEKNNRLIIKGFHKK